MDASSHEGVSLGEAPEPVRAALKDRYRFARPLGAGGSAAVYLADDLKHQRQVAIKILRPDLTASFGKERFLREVAIAANLQHPHILPLFDSGEAGGFLFYVMPYVEGPSLRQKLENGPALSVPDIVRVLRDVADAMAYALTVVVILLIVAVGALPLAERRSGHVIMLLGGVGALAMPLIHRNNGFTPAVAQSPGGIFFIWTLITLGVIGGLSIILAVRALLGSRP